MVKLTMMVKLTSVKLTLTMAKSKLNINLSLKKLYY